MPHEAHPPLPPAGGTPVASPGSGDPRGEARRGLAFALSAYLIWGMLPLYIKAVAHLPVVEVVAHRILWAVPVAGVIILALGRTRELRAALRSRRTLALAALTAGVISINWSLYVWAVAVERTVETALGYYINPLINVVLGAVLLKERFTPLQLGGVVLAVIGVAILTVDNGGLPWVSLVLAGSFATYGYLRKTLPIGPTQGFMLEVMILSPVAAGLLVWLAADGIGHFGLAGDLGPDTALLMLGGPATAVPLILYAFGAKLLRYSTIGIMQYIAPTMIFLIAVFVFGEPFGPIDLVAFAFIWSALAVYSLSFRRRQAPERSSNPKKH